MSKLYLTSTTDMHMPSTAGANKWVNTSVGYDEKQQNKKIRFNVFREEPDGELLVQIIDAAGKKQMLIECQGTEKEGLLFCEVKKLR